MTPITQAATIALFTLGTGAAAVSVMNGDIPDMVVPDVAWTDSNVLDGKAFSIAASINNGDTVTDTLVFKDGGFMSMNCEEYCNFGFSDYQTWEDGNVLHFTTVTTCSTAPHTVVWHGQVTGEQMTVEVSWTTRRWYWTHQFNGIGEGSETSLIEGAVSG